MTTEQVSRPLIPLPNAVVDQDNKVSSVEINIGSLRDNVNPAEDIVLQPYDKISVEHAEQVYTQGAIAHVGAFDLEVIEQADDVADHLVFRSAIGIPRRLFTFRAFTVTT